MAWQLDPMHSRVGWTARHYGISLVHGHFKQVEAALQLDGDDPTRWGFEATIHATSVDSACEPRDHHLRSADFFDAETFPTIHFKSNRVERLGDGYRLIGDLSCRGVTREVAVDGQFGGESRDREGNPRRGFHGETTIDMKDFKIPGSPSVANNVKLTIDAEAVDRQSAEAPR